MTETIDRLLAKGRLDSARIHVEAELLKQDKVQWDSDMMAEYDSLFKTHVVVVEAEIVDDIEIKEAYTFFTYEEDCISYSKWLTEVIVMQVETLPTYDENGVELTPLIPEITEMARPYVANDVTDKVNEFMSTYEAKVTKDAMLEALSEITVTTSKGNVFNGDDIARADMLSAILAGETIDQTSTTWKLANNSWVIVDISEMREASALSIQRKGEILSGV
jgi:hypothetical protein